MSISLFGKRIIENGLRHNLRLFNFTRESAINYVFPPCADFSTWHLGSVVNVIMQMIEGKYYSDKEKFDLDDFMPNLVVRMLVPENIVKVVIMDDEPKQIEGMEKILRAWHNVDCLTALYKEDDVFIRISEDVKIVLLDETLRQTNGTSVARLLVRQEGYKGLIASITGGSKPAFANWHFPNKDYIVRKKM